MKRGFTKRPSRIWYPVAGIAAFLFFGALSALTISPVFAQVDVGPNTDWFGGQDTARYVLEQDSNVDGAGNVTIPVYVFNGSTTNHPSISITANDSSSGFSGSTAAACISLTSAGCGGTWCQIDCSLTIPPGNFNYDPTIQGWTAYLYGHLMQGGIHEFRLTASNGATLGYYASKNPGDRSFAVAHSYTAGHRYEYVIPFGSDCTINSATNVSANIYDGDVGNSGIQPLPFRVRVIDITTGQTLVDNNYTTVAQANAAGLGNNGVATYNFTANPNHKYQFVLDNVASHNTLQFRLPFSSIYYNYDCHYTLTPTTTVSPNASEAGQNVIVNSAVTNDGAIASKNTQWQLSRFVVPVGQSVPAGGVSASTPAAFYGHSPTVLGSGTNQAYGVGVTNFAPVNNNLGSWPVGTRICYALSVQAVSDTDTRWSHGTPACVVIAKKPKVQVWGGDLSVGNALPGGSATTANVSTSLSSQGGATYGSWDEYGVTASGAVKGFGSGSSLNGGVLIYDRCAASALVFTSAGATSCTSSTVLGNYTSVQTVPNVAAAFPVGATPVYYTNSSNISTEASNRRVETTTGPVTVNGGTINPGDWLVINAPTQNVKISGNINYTSVALTSTTQIPQVVIIANCIDIAGNVTNVDAWLIALNSGSNCNGVAGGGALNTCSDVVPGGSLSTATCGNPLTINGPVMASHLYMQRTANADQATPNQSAEVFNLRPDAYLWLAQRSISAGYIQAVYTSDLPPRF